MSNNTSFWCGYLAYMFKCLFNCKSVRHADTKKGPRGR